MDVIYEEIDMKIIDADEFVITPVESESSIEDAADKDEEQITLTFDLPITKTSGDDVASSKQPQEKVMFQLDEEVKDLKVNDYVELITVTEASEDGEKRYALDDYQTVESKINKEVKPVEEEVVFETKIVEKHHTESQVQDIDPMNTPISELLKDRADERRKMMKDFNYKFNTAKVEDLEKVPAYKRQGVDLDETQHSSENSVSRTSVGLDDNDDIQLRSNNSFLHDNVD